MRCRIGLVRIPVFFFFAPFLFFFFFFPHASLTHPPTHFTHACAVERVYIATGDDNIAIKSGRNWYGRTFGRASANITIRDSVFGSGHGLSVGSEMSGGVRDVLFQNITATGGVQGPRIKSERGRGGVVENVVFRDITLRDTKLAIQLTDNYDPGIAPTNATATPIFRNITLENIVAVGAASGWVLDGLAESPIHGLTLRNISIAGPSKASDLFKQCDFVDASTAACEGVRPACPPCAQ